MKGHSVLEFSSSSNICGEREPILLCPCISFSPVHGYSIHRPIAQLLEWLRTGARQLPLDKLFCLPGVECVSAVIATLDVLFLP